MNYIGELIRVLSVEKKLYLELTDIAKKKQKVIVDNDVDQLVKYLKEEEELIYQIEKTEKERRQIVIGFCTELDIPDRELSFSKLRNHIDDSVRSKLDEFKKSLLEVLEELQQINETNRILLEEALKINDFTLRLFTQAVKPAASTYTKKGADSDKPKHLIDKRA